MNRAVDIDGDPVQFAQVCELTGLLPSGALADPPGMRVIARPERPHPGA